MPAADARDQATRDRLLSEGARLFAEHGFQRVTVREICAAARANVAAVNYHFRDKLGLYREIIEQSLAVMRETNELAMGASASAPPEARLRSFITVFVERLLGAPASVPIQQIMMHELNDPTPMLEVIADEIIRPRMTYVRELISHISGVPATDQRVMFAAFSVQSQCLMCRKLPAIKPLRLGADFGPHDAAAIAEHIATFSLAGIKAIK
jgi:AcrR family transcriptional regulator